MQKTLGELAKKIGAELKGDPDCKINGIDTLQSATEGQISFLDNPKYQQYLITTKASAVILTEKASQHYSGNAVVVKDPYYVYAQIASEFAAIPKQKSGIHSSAVIGKDCIIDSTASIAANVVIADRVNVGANTQVGAGSVIGEGCQIGADCHLWANVTLYYGVKLGDRVIIHSGVVLGSDGFGFAKHEGIWHKIPQLGSVVIERDVEIGANTTIDRGALNDTVIEEGVKLDNQIQLGHNVRIGAHSIVAGCTGIAGSAIIGKNCMIGGASSIAGHLEIADNVMLTAGTGVSGSIKETGVYSSAFSNMKYRAWQKNVVRFRNLDGIAKRLKVLEKKVLDDGGVDDD
jgi:UDP-3-O-[3-hydroxymyristoyl] glucosamine N-acyltransferase